MRDDALASFAAKAREHDPEAIAGLYEAFRPRVHRYMLYRLGSAEEAEDLTAEVFLRMVRSVADQRGSFKAWLFRICANVLADHRRRQAVRRAVTADEDAVQSAEAKGPPPGRGLEHEELRTAIAGLTEDQRDLIALKFIEGLDNAEICEVTGRTPEAVRGLQFRALASLRAILDGQGPKE